MDSGKRVLCLNCNSEVSNDSVFCNKCGQIINEEMGNVKEAPLQVSATEEVSMVNISRRVSPKIVGLFFIAVAIIIVFAIYWNNPMHRFERAFQAENYEVAQTIYAETSQRTDKNFEDNVRNYLISKVETAKNDYFDQMIDLNSAIGKIEYISWYSIVKKDADDAIHYIKKLDSSNNSYQKGINAISQKDYILGLEELTKVIIEDTNYNNAQSEIQGIIPEIKNIAFEEADNAYTNSDINKALTTIQHILKYLPEDQDLKQKESFYIAEIKEQEEAERQKNNKRKEELLNTVTRYQDSVTNSITYMPKPYGNLIDIPRNGVIFYPYLRGELGADVLKLIAGFNRGDWVFMDEIIANADGYIFKINFDYFDRNTDVGFGSGVYEWVEIPSFDTMGGSPFVDKNPNLINGLDKLAKSKSTIIRFQGDNYYFDYTLGQSEKNRISNVIELHNLSHDKSL